MILLTKYKDMYTCVELIQIFQAELGIPASEAAPPSTSQGDMSNMENDGVYQFDVDEQSDDSNLFI